MLRVFSSIRQNLLAENKTFKYMKYAVGEILLVIIGILIALQINTWNQNRLLKIEERNAISRLLVDLKTDSEILSRRLTNLEIKEASLLRVKRIFEEGAVSDSKQFLEDILLGTHHSWIQITTRRTTYDDLVGSSKLGIIASTNVRTQISDYYSSSKQNEENLALRLSPYANLTSQFVPKAKDDRGTSIEPALSHEQMDELSSVILDSPIKQYVTEEINFGRYAYNRIRVTKRHADELIDKLNTYQKEIQN